MDLVVNHSSDDTNGSNLFIPAKSIPNMIGISGVHLWMFIENHDFPRSISRFGQTSTPLLRALSTKLLAILQIGQGGTIYVYQREEIGMANITKSWGIERYKDTAT